MTTWGGLALASHYADASGRGFSICSRSHVEAVARAADLVVRAAHMESPQPVLDELIDSLSDTIDEAHEAKGSRWEEDMEKLLIRVYKALGEKGTERQRRQAEVEVYKFLYGT